ncbi:transcriptional regulator [Wenjunlia vitaminophila]|uniref:Transcriptional regulator n=1 Tax=Wenjunlia vitaminophila TaxID=76728 RepID=A0A0T6LTQ6_WENVI|nr:LCP family protein [Wenjunlia vitaminophila]KRV49475.1 transcriptional regulator [Wenjunlia vitaminophila]
MAQRGGGEERVGPGREGAGSRRLRRVLRVLTWLLIGVVLLVAGVVALLHILFSGNLEGIDIDGQLGGDRPRDVPNGTMDLLILGSDSRAGQNARYGRASGARADTAMVVHVAAGHKEATVVSIPRDTLVDRPSCRRPGGGHTPARQRVMFNDSYRVGGPACSVKTVEAMTGIRMDHYLEMDFAGFKKLVDALGGVTVTTRKPIDDRDSKLRLPAGTHHLDGEESLSFVRTRHGVGDGSDLARIELQQRFLTALLNKVHDRRLLTNPAKLYRVADAASGALTTDSEIASVKGVTDLADDLGGIKSDRLTTMVLPVDYDSADPNRLVPRGPQARQVWAALRADRPVPESALNARPEPARTDPHPPVTSRLAPVPR